MMLYSITILSMLIYVFYSWMKRKYMYWEAKGVKGPTPLPIIGNFGGIISCKESLGNLLQRIYNLYPNDKFVGIYQGTRPVLLIRDPELLKQILIKDFSTFQDRGMTAEDDFDHNLFRLGGEKWRMLRRKLTPIFTSGKLKNMMPLVEKTADAFIKYIDNSVQQHTSQECRYLAANYTLAVISSCAFGVDVDCFNDKPNEFRNLGAATFAPSMAVKFTTFINFILPGFQDFMYKLNIIDVYGENRNFFLTFTKEIIQEREGKPKTRHDFMDLMIELKEQGIQGGHNNNYEMSANLMAAQAFLFHAAGFGPSSASMAYLLYELAVNQNIQDRVHEEIFETVTKHNGKLTYDMLSEMVYLEMCIDETLRKYPITFALHRTSESDYEFPGSQLKIEKDTPIMISVMAIHHDPQYYPNPEVFDPERFTPKNKAARPPCTYLPFGEGPRHCIALRFAKVQSMIGLVALLRKYRMERCEKTEDKLEFDPKGIILNPLNGVWVKLTKI